LAATPPESAPMSAYKRVLLVVDLSDNSEHIGRRARAVAEANGAELELLHVLESVPIEPMGETLMPALEVEQELIERARRRLSELAVKLGLTESPCYVAAGNIKSEILRTATDHQVDLIVMGARERHGLAILVNFTEDTVLHAAPCDVLAIRVRD
jgi:universal stress protein A